MDDEEENTEKEEEGGTMCVCAVCPSAPTCCVESMMSIRN